MRTAALVTGAPGWLGTRLVRALAEGLSDVPVLAAGSDQLIRVLAHGQDASVLERVAGRIEVVRGDLTVPSTLEPFMRGMEGATLFHAAGVIHPTRAVREFHAVNVEGTRHLLEAAQRAGIRRFIHVSSNSPFGFNPRPDHLFDEKAPYNPYLGYGRSKKLAEDLVNEAGRSGRLETTIVRAPWFYGPDQPERQSRFIRMVKRGRVPIVGSGENWRSMAYVDNLCQGLLLAEAEHAARGQTYWIADARPYSMNEIVDTIEAVLEKDFGIAVAHRRLRLPGFVSELAVLADRLVQGAGLYHQEIHVLAELNKTIACSIDKARRELRYEPRVDLPEGMRRSVAWMLEQRIAI